MFFLLKSLGLLTLIRKCVVQPLLLSLQSLGWALLIVVFAILVYVYYLFTISLCMASMDDTDRSINLFIFHLIIALYTWCYIRTVTAPLPTPPKHIFKLPDRLINELYVFDTMKRERLIRDYVQDLPIQTR